MHLGFYYLSAITQDKKYLEKVKHKKCIQYVTVIACHIKGLIHLHLYYVFCAIRIFQVKLCTQNGQFKTFFNMCYLAESCVLIKDTCFYLYLDHLVSISHSLKMRAARKLTYD